MGDDWFLFKNFQSGLEGRGFFVVVSVDPIRKVGPVFREEVAEKLLLAFQSGIIVGVRESEVQIRPGFLIYHPVNENVVFRGKGEAIESGSGFEKGLQIEIEEASEMVGGLLLRVHPKGHDRRIRHLPQGTGFFAELDPGNRKGSADITEVGADGFAVLPDLVDFELVLVFVENVETLIVYYEGVPLGGFNLPVGLPIGDTDGMGPDLLVEDEG